MLILTTQCVTLALLVFAAAAIGVEVNENIGGEPVDHTPDHEQVDHGPIDHELEDHDPVDHEPVDHEPVDNEPVDHEPVDHDPVDHEPEDHESIDPRPVDHEQVDHEPVDHEPVDNKPVDNEPQDHDPVDHEPEDHESIDPRPVDHEPADHEQVDHEPVDHELVDHGPVDLGPVDLELADRELVDHEPVDYELVDHGPADHEPVDHEPADRELVDHEPVDYEPVDLGQEDHELVDHGPADHEPEDQAVKNNPDDSARSHAFNMHTGSSAVFANDLYFKVTRVHHSGNILFSPLTVQVSLILAGLGAGGRTAKELAVGTHLPFGNEDIKTGFRQVLQELGNVTEYRGLVIANKIFLAITRSYVLREFDRVVREDFFSEIQSIDFKSRVRSGQLINEWVNNKTHGLIPYIVGRSSFDPKTVAVLLSAAYYKGMWETTFDKDDTYRTHFYVNSRKSEEIDMMGTEALCYLVKNEMLGADILHLPLKGEAGHFVVILPFQKDGLRDVENKLKDVDLLEILDDYKKQELQIVEVHLPKFEVEQTLRLDGYLKLLGIKEMFKPSANFSGISKNSIYMNEVLTKAVLVVDEDGVHESPDEDYESLHNHPTFLANHPFIFLVQMRHCNIVTFMGRYAKPN